MKPIIHSILSPSNEVFYISSHLVLIILLAFIGLSVSKGSLNKSAMLCLIFVYAICPNVLFISANSIFYFENIHPLYKLLCIFNFVAIFLATLYYLAISNGFTLRTTNWLSVRPKLSYIVLDLLSKTTALLCPFFAYHIKERDFIVKNEEEAMGQINMQSMNLFVLAFSSLSLCNSIIK